jgi:hypothetical protein
VGEPLSGASTPLAFADQTSRETPRQDIGKSIY